MSESGRTRRDAKQDARATEALRDWNARQREEQVVRLRCKGYTFEEIARLAGYSDNSAACKAWKRALNRVPVQSVDEARREMLYDLEALKGAVGKVAYGDPEATDEKLRRPNLFGVDRMIAIMERKAKLLNLDMKPEESSAQPVKRQYVGVIFEEV